MFRCAVIEVLHRMRGTYPLSRDLMLRQNFLCHFNLLAERHEKNVFRPHCAFSLSEERQKHSISFFFFLKTTAAPRKQVLEPLTVGAQKKRAKGAEGEG